MIRPTQENYTKLSKAFSAFGLPIQAIGLSDFLNTDNVDVFSFGRPPVSLDILTRVKGLIFEDAFKISSMYEAGDISLRLIHYSSLIQAKKAVGRLKDLNDIST